MDSSEKRQVQTLTDLEKQHAPGLWLKMAEMVGHKRGARIGDVANQEQVVEQTLERYYDTSKSADYAQRVRQLHGVIWHQLYT